MKELIYDEVIEFVSENFDEIDIGNNLMVMQKISCLLDFYQIDELQFIDKIIVLLAIGKITTEKYKFIDNRIIEGLKAIIQNTEYNQLKKHFKDFEFIKVTDDITQIKKCL